LTFDSDEIRWNRAFLIPTVMGFDHYILWSGVCEKIQYMLELCQA